jgi:hypothetical protein
LGRYKKRLLVYSINFQVLQEATKKIRGKYELYEMTLQIEEFEEDMEACDQCKDPVE